MTQSISQDEILIKIQASLQERFGLDQEQLTPEARLRDLGVDSLHVLEIMLDLEAGLDTKLQDLSVPPNPSLSEVAAAIQRNLAA